MCNIKSKFYFKNLVQIIQLESKVGLINIPAPFRVLKPFPVYGLRVKII